jgi:hypothetical protein
MSLRIALLGMNKVGELGRVAKEEDGSIVEYPVEIAFISTNLDGKTTRITGSVCRARLATNRGKTNSSASFVANFLEEGGTSEVRNVVCYFKVAMCAGSLGMDLRDSR